MLPQTPTDASAERVAWGALVLLWALAVWSYFHLPDIVPVHYNLAGQVDRYGKKGACWYCR